MKFGRILVYAGAAFFVLYGLLFVVAPVSVATFFTDGSPSGGSALMDMRATYGGLTMAAGMILYLLGSVKETIRVGVVSLLVLMVGMATARTLGMFLDGDPNIWMILFLAGELITAVLCMIALNRMEPR